MWDLENNQAATLGLMSAGASMFGSSRSSGDRLNRAVQTGINTYTPMMQWQENKKDRKEDRDWKKNQDVIRNVLQERQFKLRKATAESELDNREQALNLQRARFGIEEKKYNTALEQYQNQMQFGQQMAEYMTEGKPTAAAGQPPMKMGPGGQPYGEMPQRAPLTANEEKLMKYQFMASGGKKSAMDQLGGGGGIMDPTSEQFKSANFSANDLDVEAKIMVKNGEYKTIEEARNALRRRENPSERARARMMAEALKGM
jgi:hypothetical protein